MDGLWNPAADSTLRNELFGFTTYTLLAILGLLAMIFTFVCSRCFCSTALAPSLFRAIKGKTVQDSDKALGTAVGVGLAYFLVTIMIDDMQRTGCPSSCPTWP